MWKFPATLFTSSCPCCVPAQERTNGWERARRSVRSGWECRLCGQPCAHAASQPRPRVRGIRARAVWDPGRSLRRRGRTHHVASLVPLGLEVFRVLVGLALLHVRCRRYRPTFLSVRIPDLLARVAALARKGLRAVAAQAHFGDGRVHSVRILAAKNLGSDLLQLRRLLHRPSREVDALLEDLVLVDVQVRLP